MSPIEVIKIDTEDDDREEGEIVDDFEDISSDEEFILIKRMKELEAKNEEIEIISKISCGGIGEYEYNNVQQISEKSSLTQIQYVHSDEDLSCSSLDLYKRKRKRNNRRKISRLRAYDNHYNYNNYKERKSSNLSNQHSIPYNNNKHSSISRRSYRNINNRNIREPETILIDSNDTSEDERYRHNRTVKRRKEQRITKREELRLALGRPKDSANELNSDLRKRLCGEKRTNTIEPVETVQHNQDPEITQQRQNAELGLETNFKSSEAGNAENKEEIANNCVETDNVPQTVHSEDSFSLEEQELRLIALKSAVVKKAIARKKRNELIAYSPSDFDVIPSINTDDGESNVDMLNFEENQVVMEISPQDSPKLDFSPLSQNIENSNDSREVDTKPIDMDIADSESDREIIPPFNIIQQTIEPDVVTYDSMNCYETEMHSGQSLYIPERQFETGSLQSGTIDDDVPPAPRYNKSLLLPNIDFSRSSWSEINFESRRDTHNNDQPTTFHQQVTTFNRFDSLVNSSSNDNSRTDVKNTASPMVIEESDDEANALRALLLAKIQSNVKKPNRSVSTTPKNTNKKDVAMTTVDHLSLLQLKPTESILKEAVKRLQKITQINTLQCSNPSDGSNKGCEHGEQSPSIFETMLARLHQFSDENNGGISPSSFSQWNRKIDGDIIRSCDDNTQTSCTTLSNIEKEANVIKEITRESSKDFEEERRDVENSQFLVIENEMDNALKSKDLLNNNEEKEEELYETTISQIIEIPSKVKESFEKQNLRFSPNQQNEFKDVSNDDTKSFEGDNESRDNSATIHADDTNDTTITQNINSSINTNKNVTENALIRNERPSDSFAIVPVIPTIATLVPPSEAKIVKPNKIINKRNVGNCKRKALDSSNGSQIETKRLKLNMKVATQSTVSKSVMISNTDSRLITSDNLPKFTVNKIIIPLHTCSSDAETSNTEDDSYEDERLQNAFSSTFATNDNEKATESSIRDGKRSEDNHQHPSNSIDTLTGQCNNNEFEEKLNRFLKIARMKAVAVMEESDTKNVPSPKSEKIVEDEKKKSTKQIHFNNETKISKSAVRHLPESAQREYERLVQRMKILEKQKRTKENLISKTETITATTDSTIVDTLTASTTTSPSPATSKETSPKKMLNAKVATTSNSIRRPILASQSTNTMKISPIKIKTTTTTTTTITTKFSKKNVTPMQKNIETKSEIVQNNQIIAIKEAELLKYENSFANIGTIIVSKLDNSLQMIEQAKKTKYAKIRLERRIQQLKTELQIAVKDLEMEQQKIDKLFPNIRNSNNVISSLNQKRNQIQNTATNLGKALKGKDYRLPNGLKDEISLKTEKLAMEIKVVNAINKSCDPEKIMEIAQKISPQKPVEAIIDEKNKISLNAAPKTTQLSTSSAAQSVVDDNTMNANKNNNNNDDHDDDDDDDNVVVKPNLENVKHNAKKQIVTIIKKPNAKTKLKLNGIKRSVVHSIMKKKKSIQLAKRCREKIAIGTKRQTAGQNSLNKNVLNTVEKLNEKIAQIDNDNDDDDNNTNDGANNDIVANVHIKTELLEDVDVNSAAGDAADTVGAIGININENERRNYKYQPYISPLDLHESEWKLDFKKIICPYDINGVCADQKCKLHHPFNGPNVHKNQWGKIKKRTKKIKKKKIKLN